MADPRLLKSVGYAPGQAPSDDPYYGVGIKAQPTFLEKMVRMFGGTATDPGMGPQTLEAPVGIVLNKMNAEIIKKAIGELGPEASPLDMAARFISAKYPRLSGLASKISNNPNVPTNNYGSFDNTSKTVNIFNTAQQGLKELTDTIAHELTHAAQFKRTPEMFNDYVMPEVSRNKYMNHPTEIAARKGGATATAALKKFAEDYTPQFDANQHISKSPEYINEVLVPAWSQRYKAIQENLAKATDPRSIRDWQSKLEGLKDDWQMLQNHLDPSFDPVANNRNPLTVGMTFSGLDVPNPSRQYMSVSKQGINPILKQFLERKGYSGASDVRIPMHWNRNRSQPGPKLDITDIMRSMIGK